MTTMRPYAGPADLRALQALTQRIWSKSSQCHIGDQAWQRTQHVGREHEWPTALWESAGEVVAWGWAWLPGDLMLLVDPARPELAGEVIRWFETVARAPRLTATVLDAEQHLIDALVWSGFRRDPTDWFLEYRSRTLGDLPDPVVPPGFRVRTVGPGDDAARVAVHRAAWEPSRFTEESYRSVRKTWPYRSTLDWIAEAPGGEFAANCLIWPDEVNRVGLLEPVGTDPRFRGLGLARAVCLAALHALRESGADQAVVYPVRGGKAHPGAVALYESLGFTPYARSVTYARE
jgi:ribosomal protein S18 acetylase RimI-like enzyme